MRSDATVLRMLSRFATVTAGSVHNATSFTRWQIRLFVYERITVLTR